MIEQRKTLCFTYYDIIWIGHQNEGSCVSKRLTSRFDSMRQSEKGVNTSVRGVFGFLCAIYCYKLIQDILGLSVWWSSLIFLVGAWLPGSALTAKDRPLAYYQVIHCLHDGAITLHMTNWMLAKLIVGIQHEHDEIDTYQCVEYPLFL